VGPGDGRVDMRILVILMLSGTLGVLGCDSDDGGTDAAAAFCADYGEICGFDGAGHQSEQECEAAYNGYDAARQTCVETHLGLADSSMDTATHCPHATGAAPCDGGT
jgi:hypothetical protein